ncbi:MAG: GxGYxYP family putative glycoside hydrolase [Reichenbachiella sp.]
MKILFLGCICLIVFVESIGAQSVASRLEGSPFPVSQIPDTLYTIKSGELSQGKSVTVMTLQGLLAKTKPRIDFRGKFWLKDLVENHGIIADSTYLLDFNGLITKFKDEIDGYYLCTIPDNTEPSSESCHVAISLSGINNAITVTPESDSLMNALGIPLLADVSSKTQQWALDNYGDLFSRDIVMYQKPDKLHYLSDYSAYTGAFFFYDNISSTVTQSAFERMNDNSLMYGWGDDEYEVIKKTSENGVLVHPADWQSDLSTLSNLSAPTVQFHPDPNTTPLQADVHTVTFVVSDGDNICWLLGGFVNEGKWYSNPKRGSVNVGWTMSPALTELAPTAMQYLYENASKSDTARDYFIAGPSGFAYSFPDYFSPEVLASAPEILNKYMEKADLGIVNFLSNSDDETFLKPYLDQENIDAIFYMDYANYAARGEEISFINNKPVIGARYRLWDGFNSTDELAEKLNTQTISADTQAGYSIISVHAWSMPFDSIVACIGLLNENILVVTPDVFVQRINHFMGKLEVSNEGNIALKKSNSATASSSPDREKQFGNDGDPESYWLSDPADPDPYFQVDLDTTYALSKIELVTRQESTDEAYRNNFEVWGAIDETFNEYTVLAECNSVFSGVHNVWTHSITDEDSYRYIRVQRTNGAGKFSVAEFRLFGDVSEKHVEISSSISSSSGIQSESSNNREQSSSVSSNYFSSTNNIEYSSSGIDSFSVSSEERVSSVAVSPIDAAETIFLTLETDQYLSIYSVHGIKVAEGWVLAGEVFNPDGFNIPHGVWIARYSSGALEKKHMFIVK